MIKSFATAEVKTYGEAGSGQFEAVVSVFGNVDAVKDRVMTGAFSRSVKELPPPPVVWSHFWSIPPIGETIDWGEQGKGLNVKGALFVGADDKHQYADMVYAAMKSRDGRPPALREFSFAYDIPEGGQEKKTEEIDGKQVVVNELQEIFPVNEVGPCLKGCNPATELVAAPKSYSAEGIARLERLAVKLGKSVPDLIAMIEEHFDKESAEVLTARVYPREMLDVLTAVPGH